MIVDQLGFGSMILRNSDSEIASKNHKIYLMIVCWPQSMKQVFKVLQKVYNLQSSFSLLISFYSQLEELSNEHKIQSAWFFQESL